MDARLIAALPIILVISGCARAVVQIPPARCHSLIPKSWADGVPGAALPAGDATADWQKAFVAQSGQLSKANGRTVDSITIFGACEALVNDARP